VTRQIFWLAEAHDELMEALEHYEAIRPELGERFANAVIETVQAMAETPLHFAVIDNGRRRAGVRRFPYGLFFLVEETRIVVIACFHGKRNPKSWQQR
jgi:plasmid stabilization system protein ParE